MDMFWAAPPVSRTITALTFAQSLLVHGRVLSGYYVVFLPRLLFKLPPQIWRLVSSFMLTGSKLQFVFDLYFMYYYSSALETASPRFTQPEDFFTYLVFVASVILLTSGFLLGNVIFTSALILAMVYTYSQDNRGRTATFIIVPMPVQYLPFAMLALTFVMSGVEAAMAEGMGIIAAHAYDFFTRIYPAFGGGRNWIKPPGFVRRYFRGVITAPTRRPYGTAFRQPTYTESEPQSADSQAQAQAQAQSSGWTSAFRRSNASDPWASRGEGRRLG